MVKSEFSLKTVKEEISEGSQGPSGPHDIARTTSPQLTSGEDETENLETGHIENDLTYYEQEEHFKHHFEYDPVEKVCEGDGGKVQVVFDSEDYQDDGLAFTPRCWRTRFKKIGSYRWSLHPSSGRRSPSGD